MNDALVLRGAALFADPTRGVDVVVSDGVVREVAAAGSVQTDAAVVDLDGLLLMPGAIDPHVHPIHDETFASVGNAAVFGGITTICNQLYPDPGEPFGTAIDRMAGQGADGTADFAAHLRWDRSRTAADVLEGAERGALSIKVFLAHPDKSIQASLGELAIAMTAARDAGLDTLVHCELGDVVDRMLDLGHASRETLEDVHHWRSTDNEAAAVTAAALVARGTGARLYVVHASCADALGAATAARSRGTALSVETCPHYAFLDVSSAPSGGPGFVLPPLRTLDDQRAVRNAIVSGLVDTMGSDHCGHGEASKPHEIAASKAGLPGLEAMLPLLIDAALGDDAWLPRQRLLELVCEGPSRVFGLGVKGRLRPGYDADVVAIDPAGSTTLGAQAFHDAAGYSPYQGRNLRGSIARVWRRGDLVVDGGHAVVEGGGRLIPRSREA